MCVRERMLKANQTLQTLTVDALTKTFQIREGVPAYNDNPRAEECKRLVPIESLYTFQWIPLEELSLHNADGLP